VTFSFFLNLAIFIALLVALYKTAPLGLSLAAKTFIALISGVAFGSFLQLIYGHEDATLGLSLQWFDLVGGGYVRLLQMIIMPLVFASILAAVTKLHNATSLGKISSLTIGTLLLTTMISAIVGVAMVGLFGLSAEGLVQGQAETARLALIESNYIGRVSDLTLPQTLLSFLPRNPFAELTGANPTSIIAVVIFATLLGLAALSLNKDDTKKGMAVFSAIDSFQALVMKLVRLIIRLTPYGIFALMTKMMATSNISAILQLISFVVASYIGLALMFGVHGAFIKASGLSPLSFFKKILPVLTFAFTSRSSAATIPLNIEAQTNRIGVPSSIASFAASFGATIGQNGCAGLYPAMLAVMVAPTVGINPFDPLWLISLIGIVTISSLGVAGVGGGATFAALIVLPAMGLPVTLVALLISIEPLIDMGRTALNVSGAMTAGAVTSQILGQTDKEIFARDESVSLRAAPKTA